MEAFVLFFIPSFLVPVVYTLWIMCGLGNELKIDQSFKERTILMDKLIWINTVEWINILINSFSYYFLFLWKLVFFISLLFSFP